MGALSLFRKSRESSKVTKENPYPFIEHKKLQALPCTICNDKKKRFHFLDEIWNVKCDECGRRICTKCVNRVYRRKGTRRYYRCCPFCLAALAQDKGGLKVYTDWKDK